MKGQFFFPKNGYFLKPFKCLPISKLRLVILGGGAEVGVIFLNHD